MTASVNDKLTATFNAANPNVARVTSARTAGVTTLACDNLAGWPTVSKVHFSTYSINTSGGAVAGTQIDWYGIVSGNNLTNLTRLAGATDAGNAIGDVVEAMPTGSWAQGIYDWGTSFADTQGNLSTTAVQTALGLGTSALNGWNALGYAPNTVVYNGNRSYTLTFNGVDLTPTLSAGMRLRTTRTVAAPTQSTSLNGTSQYYSKTSPAGMTFTNNFVMGAAVKPSAYSLGIIQGRFDGTSGWFLRQNADGTIEAVGFNGGIANFFSVKTYQSVPLNKWVNNIAAQMDMTVTTNSPTTNYIMIDGVDVPCVCTRGGTNPTALLQGSGAYQIGAANSANFYAGKIAQAFVFSAKVTQATIQSYISQTLAGTETNLISAYSFNNTINDLNTTNANNLTANGSAVATATDSPFGGQAGGAISPTLDYDIVQSAAYSTNTTVVVQVPEGCTIPTIGGVSAVVYSSSGKPYGMPVQKGKWQVEYSALSNITQASAAAGTYYNVGTSLNIPIGEWSVSYQGSFDIQNAGAANLTFWTALSTANNTQGDIRFYAIGPVESPSATNVEGSMFKQNDISLAAATVYYLNLKPSTGSSTLVWAGSDGTIIIRAENAYL